MLVAAVFTHAEAVASICLVTGLVFLIGGAGLGVHLSLKGTGSVRTKVAKAQESVDALKRTAVRGTEAEPPDAADVTAAAAQHQATSSALGEIDDIIGSLPENLRFAGLLVLIGALLVSVATVQFGGHSLF